MKPEAERLLELFRGNTRTSGRYYPDRDRAVTEHEPLTLADFEAHLAGKVGCGSVPIQDDDTCSWGAIDIDNHDSDEDIPLRPMAELIESQRLPLIACRSKSGGIHVYLFLDKAQPVARIRPFLMKWAGVLGHAGCEVFPKQTRLSTGGDGKKQAGNWLNLPYFGNGTTMRYAVRGGKQLSLQEFLDAADQLKVSDKSLGLLSSSGHPEAPPCVQQMLKNGVAAGHRNEALYAVSVYFRKSQPETFQAAAAEVNGQMFAKPLARGEATRTIASAGKPDYGYRCNEEPCRSLCDRATCLTRKFGITPADRDRLEVFEALPEFTDLVKYMTSPPRWDLKANGKAIRGIQTDELFDWKWMQLALMNELTIVAPSMKNLDWQRILAPLAAKARLVETPDDASIAGIIRERLREFAGKTDLHNKGLDKEDRKGLVRGLPVVQVVDGERCVVFRMPDFVNYLKRTRSEEMKGTDLWFAIKDLGVRNMRMRIPGAKSGEDNINVYHLPVKAVMQPDATAPEFRSEL